MSPLDRTLQQQTGLVRLVSGQTQEGCRVCGGRAARGGTLEKVAAEADTQKVLHVGGQGGGSAERDADAAAQPGLDLGEQQPVEEGRRLRSREASVACGQPVRLLERLSKAVPSMISVWSLTLDGWYPRLRNLSFRLNPRLKIHCLRAPAAATALSA